MYNQGIGVSYPAKGKGLLLRHSRQICSEVHSMVTGGYFLWIKPSRRQMDHSLSCIVEAKNVRLGWSVSILPCPTARQFCIKQIGSVSVTME
jgi:hypothetical protein